jgi:hypothetical protein
LSFTVLPFGRTAGITSKNIWGHGYTQMNTDRTTESMHHVPENLCALCALCGKKIWNRKERKEKNQPQSSQRTQRKKRRKNIGTADSHR